MRTPFAAIDEEAIERSNRELAVECFECGRKLWGVANLSFDELLGRVCPLVNKRVLKLNGSEGGYFRLSPIKSH